MVNADATIASVHCTVLYIVQRVAELYGGWPDPRVGLRLVRKFTRTHGPGQFEISQKQNFIWKCLVIYVLFCIYVM